MRLVLMDAAVGGLFVESRSASMGVVLFLRVFGNGSITWGGETVFAVTRVFFCDCGMVGDLVVLWVWVLLEREGGCL